MPTAPRKSFAHAHSASGILFIHPEFIACELPAPVGGQAIRVPWRSK